MYHQYAQGDLLFIHISQGDEAWLRDPAPRRGDLFVLARGERSGHEHVVDAAKATYFVRDDERWLMVKEPTEVRHVGKGPGLHPPLKLEPGVYRVRQARQFDFRSLRGRMRWRDAVD